MGWRDELHKWMTPEMKAKVDALFAEDDEENWAGPGFTRPYTEQEEEGDDASPQVP